MESSDINHGWDLESPRYQNQYIHEPIGGSFPFNPFNLLPDPLLSGITTPPSSQYTEANSFSLTGEDATHVDNLLFHGIDSPVLPPDILLSHMATTEMVQALYPVLLQPSDKNSASSASPLPASSSLSSTTIADAMLSTSPPAHKHDSPTVDPANRSQGPNLFPSAPRPAKRPRTSYPGESSFRLDPTVASRRSSGPTNRPRGTPHSRPDYPACRCSALETSNRARHWRDSCPYNPEANGKRKRFTCDTCGKQFTREDNRKRHIKEYH